MAILRHFKEKITSSYYLGSVKRDNVFIETTLYMFLLCPIHGMGFRYEESISVFILNILFWFKRNFVPINTPPLLLLTHQR